MIQTLQPSQPFRPSPDFTTKRHWEISNPNVRFSPRSPKRWIDTTNSQLMLIKGFGPVDFFGVCESHRRFRTIQERHGKRRWTTQEIFTESEFHVGNVFLCGCFGICSLWEVWNIYWITIHSWGVIGASKFGDGPLAKLVFVPWVSYGFSMLFQTNSWIGIKKPISAERLRRIYLLVTNFN